LFIQSILLRLVYARRVGVIISLKFGKLLNRDSLDLNVGMSYILTSRGWIRYWRDCLYSVYLEPWFFDLCSVVGNCPSTPLCHILYDSFIGIVGMHLVFVHARNNLKTMYPALYARKGVVYAILIIVFGVITSFFFL